MSEAKFTKGPWEAKEATYDVEGDFKWWLHSPSYGAVGYWTGHKQRHEDSRWILTKEDAHLIAAAPELYDLLESLSVDNFLVSDPEWWLKVGKALAKARGEV